jgi:inner membrane protease subunit 2
VSFDKVTGSSMAPTLNARTHETGWRDRLLIHTTAWVKEDVKRGDIITFWKPHKAEEISIKRVVAVGGDTVFPNRGFFVDRGFLGLKKLGLMDGLGKKEEDGWVKEGKEVGVLVPHGHIWVEGDNWRETLDSCEFGPISLALVEGRASRVWSWSRLGFHKIGDQRLSKDSRKGASRVVEGRSRIPDEFVE